MTRTHVQERVDRPYIAFPDREEAGRRLARFVDPPSDPEAVVLAVPRGGIPVGKPLAAALECPLQPVLTRKLPIPGSPEAGFGAVSLETGLELNDHMVNSMGIGEHRIQEVVNRVREELQRRAREYDIGKEQRSPRSRHVYLVDDGLATGYTIIAAAQEVLSKDPARLTLGVPVSPSDSLERVQEWFDEIFCLISQSASPFGVANFYSRFEEMSDEQVRAHLREAR